MPELSAGMLGYANHRTPVSNSDRCGLGIRVGGKFKGNHIGECLCVCVCVCPYIRAGAHMHACMYLFVCESGSFCICGGASLCVYMSVYPSLVPSTLVCLCGSLCLGICNGLFPLKPGASPKAAPLT